ncbi:hypothetical protein BH09BAC2_BH09BAC2_00040 [soil metagenome]
MRVLVSTDWTQIGHSGLRATGGQRAMSDRIWENAMADFLASGKRSANTKNMYARDIERYADWCRSLGYEPLEIEPARVREYERQLATTHKPATVGRELGVLRRFFDYLAGKRIIPGNPMADVRWYEAPRVFREVPGVAELRRLWELCGDDNERAVVGLLGFCGMRPNELIEANLSNIAELDGVGILRIPSRTNPHQRQYVALIGPLAESLGRLRESLPSGSVVRTAQGNRVDRARLRVITRRLGKRAELPYALNPLHLSYCLRAVAIEHGFPYAELIRSVGEMESRKLVSWVSQTPGGVEESSTLRLGQMVVGAGSESMDALHQARDILSSTNAPPAATAAFVGATVERHLRKLALAAELEEPNSPKLSAYGALLRRHNIIDSRSVHLLNRMQDLRNSAAHGHFDLVSESDARWMIENALALFTAYPVPVTVPMPS